MHGAGINHAFLRLDRLDSAILIVSVILLATLGLIIARGDQIGLTITAFSPRDVGSIRARIHITFDQPVEARAAQPYFSIDPPVQGVLHSSLSEASSTLTFTPTDILAVGQTYTVRLGAGIVSAQSVRSLKEDQVWTFTIRQPRILFLGTDPNDQLVQNLYLADPDSPQSKQQLTFSTNGVLEFDPSPDGSKVAFSEFQQTGSNSLFLWESATGKVSLLFECTNAICNNPVWSPDGRMIAFERSEVGETGVGVARVWLLDLESNRVRPLLSDSQQIGYDPHWSPDSIKVAVYSVSRGGIVLHDLAAGTDQIIPSAYGETGKFSPDGKRMIFPQMVEVQQRLYAAHYVAVDLESAFLTQSDIVPHDDPSSDVEAVWLDAQTLIVARQGSFQAAAGGIRPGPQLYTLDVATGIAVPLLIDMNFTNGNLAVSPLQDRLAFQRFELGRQGARTEVWTLNLATGEAELVANNAMLPRWIP